MERFTVQGKEYKLSIDFDSVEYLNSLYDGGAMQLIAKVMTGDVSTFVHVIHAALFHTGQNFALETIRSEVKKLFTEGKLDLNSMMKTGYNMIADSFFYKPTVEKMMSRDPRMKTELEMLLK